VERIAQLEETRSHVMQQVLDHLRQVAPTPFTVLLQGESGAGKEVVARFVHGRSARSRAPFVAVNVASIAPTLIEATLFGHEKGAFTGADRPRAGKFEQANGGTLFLDEIGDLALAHQAALLRVIQEREIERLGAPSPSRVDVRLVCATHKDLAAEVVAGRFREDLFHRLNVVRVTVPPLRARREDVAALAGALARRHAHALGREPPSFTPAAIRALEHYPWPGNVRELENLVIRLVVLYSGRAIDAADLPMEYCLDHLSALALEASEREGDDRSLFKLAVGTFERLLVEHMISREGSRRRAAQRLGVSLSTLKNKLAAK
jgi:DNA-binding NtrC family response regulator